MRYLADWLLRLALVEFVNGSAYTFLLFLHSSEYPCLNGLFRSWKSVPSSSD